jgi:hypothetical protein
VDFDQTQGMSASAVLSTQRDQAVVDFGSVAQDRLHIENSIGLQAGDELTTSVDQIIEKSEIVEASIKNPQHSGLYHPQNLVFKAGIVGQRFAGVPDLLRQTRGQVDHRADLACQCPLGCVFQSFQFAKQGFQSRTIHRIDVREVLLSTDNALR